ncbi:MAG: DUF3102 domain-containing protein [Ruminococcus sp.]|nr:DUF3102 domain-containing protein [Ruminococcus sp.]
MSDIIISENYNKAVSLHRRICANAQAAQESLYEMCKALKEMRDGKLYKELGYQNFEDYTEGEVGIGRKQAYKYISISENLGEDFVSPGRQIGVAKLYLLSTLSEEERTEITENNDVSTMSKRDLETKIADLKKANDRLMSKVEEAEKRAENSRKSEEKACGRASILETDNESYKKKIEELESQVEELESRPIEVAVQESHEVENMRKAMEKLNEDIGRQMSDLQDENIREVRRLNDKHNAEIQKLTDEHSKAIQTMAESHNEEMEKLSEEFEARLEEAKAQAAPGETVTVVDTKAIFKAYFSGAIDSINRLFSFMETAAQDENAQAYISKLFTLADMINDKTKKFKED